MRSYKISYIILGVLLLSVFILLSFSSINNKREPDTSVLAEDIENLSVTVSKDSYISSTNKSANYGSSNTIKVKDLNTSNPFDNTDENNIAYFHFDLRNYAPPAGKEYDFDCGTCKISLKFETSNTGLSDSDGSGYFTKGIRLIPYDNWSESSISYNTMRELHPTTNNQVGLLLKHFQYPVIEQFVVTDNAGNSTKQSEYNAVVTPTGTSRNSIVQVDITEDVAELLGYEFTLVMESYRDFRGESLDIYSKEASGKIKPQLEISYRLNDIPDDEIFAHNFSPAQITDLNQKTKNPYTGLHTWFNNNSNPNFTDSVDVYERFVWSDVEPAQGVYNFSVIQNELNKLQPGQKFAFRMRAMRGTGNDLPSYLSSRTMSCSNSCGSSFSNVPDWDDPVLLERGRALAQAMAQEFDGHPKIAWIDLGIFGRFGEWNCACAETVSDSVAKEYVDMYTDYFDNTQLILRDGQKAAFSYALSKPANNAGFKVGFRLDGYGQNKMYATYGDAFRHFSVFNSTKDQWKVAPVLGEFWAPGSSIDSNATYYQTMQEAQSIHTTTIGNGNTKKWSELNAQQKEDFNDLGYSLGYKYILENVKFKTALFISDSVTVETSWSNKGNAPTYENWTPKLTFTNNSNPNQNFTVDLDTINLKGVIPTLNRTIGVNTPIKFIDTFSVPSGIADGNYSISLKIEQSGRNNLKLYNQDNGSNNPLSSDGIYTIGNIDIESFVACDSIEYSGFGTCINGVKTRTATQTSPSNCSVPEESLKELCTVNDSGGLSGGGGGGAAAEIINSPRSKICPDVDYDSNGGLDYLDFISFRKYYKFNCTSSSTYSTCGSIDSNASGNIDLNDFIKFSIKYASGETCN
ncbi:DUF4832 domain-containing protein [Candidatus Dojkabacteria bacterium]|uniref:DUF4832 domain-containing protein n=1 Tax=Candidatus Dojkabacteria bacterium TaxID=2099670 RepID=A0A955RL22_9BACT|nr:DUF4832 domain-containing protein [Candidatus Dojkabacteria bacterium]